MSKIPESLNNITSKIIKTSPLSGGSICNTELLQTADDQYYVYKQLTSAPDDFFVCEQSGLATLAENHIFKTPKVYAATADGILMRYIESIQPNNQHWYRFGEKLARLHQIKNKNYGFAENNFIGLIAQQNSWQQNWLTFYREQRLLPLINHPLFNQDDQRQ